MRLIAWLTIVTAARRLSDLKEERHDSGFAFDTILSLFPVFYNILFSCLCQGRVLFILFGIDSSRNTWIEAQVVSLFLNRSIDRSLRYTETCTIFQVDGVFSRNALNASPTINPFTVQRAGPRCEQPAALNPGDRFSRSWISWLLWRERERGEEVFPLRLLPLEDTDFRRVIENLALRKKLT